MSGRPVRVLHVIQNLNYGGMERVLSDIVRLADRERFESHILCLQYLGRYSQGLEEFARLHLSPPLGRASMLWPRALAAEIRRIAPDVVHTHSGVWYKGSLAARQARAPRVIHTEHGRAVPDVWTHRLVDGLAARRTDVVVAVSEVLAGYLARALRVSPRKVTVVRNGVDTDLYRPRGDDGRIRRELGLGAATPIVGSIGRLERVKGYDVMIEAFALLRAGWSGDAPPVLVVAGEGAQRGLLEQRVAALGLEGAVRLLGWRDDPHDLHAAFTVFTLSSRSEGTSISLLEAMSAGLCPVVTDVGGNRAVLGGALEHRLVRPGDPEGLAAAWRAALADGPARRQDACRARERVVAEFSAAAMVRAYEVLYAVRGVPPSPLSSADRPPTM